MVALIQHLFCFECLGWDHTESGMIQPPPCVHCRALLPVHHWQWWDHFQLCEISLHCDESASPMDDDDNLSPVSATLLTFGNLPQTSVRHNFPTVMSMAAERVGHRVTLAFIRSRVCVHLMMYNIHSPFNSGLVSTNS